MIGIHTKATAIDEPVLTVYEHHYVRPWIIARALTEHVPFNSKSVSEKYHPFICDILFQVEIFVVYIISVDVFRYDNRLLPIDRLVSLFECCYRLHISYNYIVMKWVSKKIRSAFVFLSCTKNYALQTGYSEEKKHLPNKMYVCDDHWPLIVPFGWCRLRQNIFQRSKWDDIISELSKQISG